VAKRNRKREAERKRAIKYQERIGAKQARRKRNRMVAGIIVAALVLGGVAGLAVLAFGGKDTPAATPPATPTAIESNIPLPTDDATGDATGSNPKATYAAVPDKSLAEDREWTGTITTSVGALGITLDGVKAPQATANFLQLAKDGYYDGSDCHRLTTEGLFVLQCGSLAGDGSDDPGYEFGPLENVPEDGVYPVGTIAMARAQSEDSQGSQFFIVYKETTLPGGYSVFGHVTSGMEAIDAVAAAGVAPDATGAQSSDGRPATTVTIDGIELK
jgi:peptidyl-prolyl cis-trans isomerase B (cyclophilin B)